LRQPIRSSQRHHGLVRWLEDDHRHAARGHDGLPPALLDRRRGRRRGHSAPNGTSSWSNRWQAWDAPFSLDRQQITLIQAGVGSKTYTAEPVTTFWDSSPTAYYQTWGTTGRFNSVKTAVSGVRLRLLDANEDRSVYTVQVDKK
jgi:hypothetical protein